MWLKNNPLKMANKGFDEHWKKKVFVETVLYNLKTFFIKP